MALNIALTNDVSSAVITHGFHAFWLELPSITDFLSLVGLGAPLGCLALYINAKRSSNAGAVPVALHAGEMAT